LTRPSKHSSLSTPSPPTARPPEVDPLPNGRPSKRNNTAKRTKRSTKNRQQLSEDFQRFQLFWRTFLGNAKSRSVAKWRDLRFLAI
jgi:hypothetical protein